MTASASGDPVGACCFAAAAESEGVTNNNTRKQKPGTTSDEQLRYFELLSFKTLKPLKKKNQLNNKTCC